MFCFPNIESDRHSVHLHARAVILKLKRGHCDQQSCNKRTCNNRRAINDYMERLHPMMKYGNFIEVYNNIVYFSVHLATDK